MNKLNLTKYERNLIAESVSNYITYLDEKEELLDELKGELHVTQEIDDLINEYRLKRRSMSGLFSKI